MATIRGQYLLLLMGLAVYVLAIWLYAITLLFSWRGNNGLTRGRLADVFTKALPAPQHNYLVSQFMVSLADYLGDDEDTAPRLLAAKEPVSVPDSIAAS